MDYFILQDIRAKGLAKDTSIMGKKSRDQAMQIFKYEKVNQANDSLSAIRKIQYEAAQKRGDEWKSIADKGTKIINRQRKVIGVTGGTSAIAILILLIKIFT